MLRYTRIAMLAVLFVGTAGPPAFGAPCVIACRDEVAACRAAECAGLVGNVRGRCRHACKANAMKDCFLDLSVCGATTARPGQPAPPAGGGGW
jgi:hypothetical protein